MSESDVVIIGAGHNGLTCAAYLATAGLRVRVVEVERRWQVRSALHAHIQDAFNAAGVQIMSPNYEGDPEQAKVVPKAHWEGRPAPASDET